MDNNITITGNIVKEPELRYTQTGKAVAAFTVAVNRRRKQGDDWVDETSFIDVTAWDSLASNSAESVPKGTRVTVTGSVKQDTWEDKQTGQKRSKLVVTAAEVAVSLKWATVNVTRNERGSDAARKQQEFKDSNVKYNPNEEPF